jgi:uncharacterized protein
MAPRVAVVGSGISGLAAAWALAADARVTLFEAGGHFGGHSHTVDVTLDGVSHGVDTGFLVFNHRTYPGLVRLFDELKIDTAMSQMSFSVQRRDPGGAGLEWSGTSLNAVFAQRSNLLRPGFWRMLAQIVRFNGLATAIAARGAEQELAQTIGDFLDQHRFGQDFREAYFLPMIGCIWSCPTDVMLGFPVATMIRFCHNHGLLQLTDRPQWYTVRGGSRQYVRRLLERIPDARLNTPVHAVHRLPPGLGSAGVKVRTDSGEEIFDEVVLACHSDQALALLADSDARERSLLGAIRYQPNRAVLHTDTSMMPKRRLAWAAWNYERAAPSANAPEGAPPGVCLHYWINRLQPLPWATPVIVSLNPARPIDPAQTLGVFDYSHPVFDQAALSAQARLREIQGRSHVWFCGAWAGYGFHEDGLRSGLAAADALRRRWAQRQGLARAA